MATDRERSVEHHLGIVGDDGDGGHYQRCSCGWRSGRLPSTTDALSAWMDHQLDRVPGAGAGAGDAT